MNKVEFFRVYDLLHEVCPKCGSDNYESTCVGCLLIDPETYKDENDCTCLDCGDQHIVHDRVQKNNGPAPTHIRASDESIELLKKAGLNIKE